MPVLGKLSRTNVKACWISAVKWGNVQFDAVALLLPVSSAGEIGGDQLVDTGLKKKKHQAPEIFC